MKSLKKYIYEEYSSYHLNEVVVKFDIQETDLVVEVPEDYLEDKIQMYLDDSILQKVLANHEMLNKLFGRNANYLLDAYFEYTGIEQTSLSVLLKWDAHYDTSKNDVKLKRMKLKNFKMILKFNSFYILDSNPDNIMSALEDIFKRCISDEFEWPLNFTLDPNNIEYRR